MCISLNWIKGVVNIWRNANVASICMSHLPMHRSHFKSTEISTHHTTLLTTRGLVCLRVCVCIQPNQQTSVFFLCMFVLDMASFPISVMFCMSPSPKWGALKALYSQRVPFQQGKKRTEPCGQKSVFHVKQSRPGPLFIPISTHTKVHLQCL